jgi:hypothetical protein
VPVDPNARVKVVRRCHDGDDDDNCRGHGHGHGHGNGHQQHNWRCPWTLIVKFDHDAIAETVTPGSSVPVLISGTIGSQCFEEVTNIKVRAPHMRPNDNEIVAPSSITELQWDAQEAAGISSLALVSSSDGGATWDVVRTDVPNTGSYSWRAPASASGPMRLAIIDIEELDEDGIIGDSELAESGTFTVQAPTGVADGPALSLALKGVTPNPAREDFTVMFALPSAEAASLELFDVSGRSVTQRAVGGLGKGVHRVTLGQGQNLRPGIYMVRLTQAGRSQTTRVAVVP